jgi:ABC-2 type transport system permease protein
MSLTPIAAMVRKDLRLFLSDRRAVIMSFIVPIAIASFFGSIFSGSGSSEAARIPVAIVDEDHSAVSVSIVARAQADATFQVTTPGTDEARAAVRRGEISVGVMIPPGFGQASSRAFFTSAARPELTVWYDPSRVMEMGLVRGVLTQHVMEAVSAEVFGGASGQALVEETLGQVEHFSMPDDEKRLLRDVLTSARQLYGQRQGAGATGPGGGRPRGITIPYTVRAEAVTSADNRTYNGYAHSFAGMSIQFLFFAMIDLGVGILLERERGLWKRLRSAPVSRVSLLAGKSLSGTLIALMSLLVSFAFAIVIFKVRIHGSTLGFLLVAVSCALMACTFGLLIASVGRTPGATRGVASLAVLMMVMLGGAWVPTFVFPAWLQRLTVVVPARWAVDGLDAMTWRGLGLQAALAPTLVLLGFAVLFGVTAYARFRWEE